MQGFFLSRMLLSSLLFLSSLFFSLSSFFLIFLLPPLLFLFSPSSFFPCLFSSSPLPFSPLLFSLFLFLSHFPLASHFLSTALWCHLHSHLSTRTGPTPALCDPFELRYLLKSHTWKYWGQTLVLQHVKLWRICVWEGHSLAHVNDIELKYLV